MRNCNGKTIVRRWSCDLLFVLTIGLILVTTGCGGRDNVINIGGSTTVQPIAEKLAISYMSLYPDEDVEVTGGGSSTGIRSVANGILDIGTSSRELTNEEAAVLTRYQLATDGIALVVHPSLEISGLTSEQVAAIFKGEITNWSEVGGPDAEIYVVAREAGSGTRDTFEERMLHYEPIVSTALLQSSNGAVRTTVAGLENSITFVSIAYIDDTVKALELDGVFPSFETVENGTWPLVRPLYLLTRGEARGKASEFINYCLSAEGQQIVLTELYLGVE